MRRPDSIGTVYLDARGRPCVTAREAARRLGVSQDTLRHALLHGRLPATKAGPWYNAEWLVPVAALSQWVSRVSPTQRAAQSQGQRAREDARRARRRVIAELIGGSSPK